MRTLFAIILSLGLILAPVPVVNTAHAGGGGSYAKVVLGMANGVIGSVILTKCTLGASQPSLLIYMAGSLVYVAAEILGGKTKQSDNKQNAQSLDQLKANMKEGGDYQKAAVQGQIDSEKSNLKHIQKKRKYMMATKAIYAAATAMAIVEWIWHFPPPPAGIGILKLELGGCTPNPATHIPMELAIVTAYAAANGYASGGLLGAGMAAGLAAGGGAYLMEFLGLMKVGDTATDLAVTMLNMALSRVAFFAAATALVMLIDGELKKEEDRAKNNIAELQKVLGVFDGASNALAEGDSTPGATDTGSDTAPGSVGSASGKAAAIRALPKADALKPHCFSNTQQGPTFSVEGCKSPMTLVRPTFPGGKLEIPALQQATNTSLDMAQAVANGDLAKADIESGKLASMAGKIDAINSELMAKANDILKKQGQKPIDVNGEIQRQVAALNNELNKQKAGSGKFSMAEFSGLKNGNPAAIGKGEETKAEEIKAAAVNGAPAVEGIDLSKVGDGTVATEDDPNAAMLSDLGKGTAFEQSLSKYETTEGEIVKDPEVSIFKQVSNRYFLNYTKLFERKKVVDPPLAQPKGAH